MAKPATFFKTDADLETQGVWLEFAPGFRIKVRRAGGNNSAFNRVLEAKGKPYRYQIQQETLDDEIDKRLTLETYIETVVVDWEWQDEDGNSLPFTADNVKFLFEADPDLYAEVRRRSNAIATFRAEGMAADAKNSQAGSTGKKNGAVGSASSKGDAPAD